MLYANEAKKVNEDSPIDYTDDINMFKTQGK